MKLYPGLVNHAGKTNEGHIASAGSRGIRVGTARHCGVIEDKPGWALKKGKNEPQGRAPRRSNHIDCYQPVIDP